MRSELNSGRVHHAYLLLGESSEARNEAYQAIEEATIEAEWRDLCVNTFDGEQATADEILETVSTVPFMGSTRLVYVKRFDQLSADEQNMIAEACAKALPGSVLVMSAQAIDRRRKGIQTLLGSVEVVECSPPQGSALIQWLTARAEERGLKLRREAAITLVGQVGERTDQLVQELDKLAAYLGSGSTVKVDDVALVVTVSSPEAAQNEIFQLCDAVAEGRVQAVLLGLDKLFSAGANPIYIVTMLARHYRRLLAVKCHGSKSPILLDKELGLRAPRFAVERLVRQADALEKEAIEEALRLLLKADKGLKRSALGRSTVESTALHLARMRSA